MKRISLTQDKYAIVDDNVFNYLNQWKWHYLKSSNGGYAQRFEYSKNIGVWKGKSILMHRFIMECPQNKIIDHKDGKGLNNQVSNLRACSNQQNLKNRKLNADNKTGYKGVTCYKNRFRCHINRRYIGTFNTASQAALAYDLWAEDMNGEYKNSNFQSI